MTDRLFHFTDEKSNKFWRITLENNTHTVTFGRIGTAGQTQTKEFGSEALAKSSYDKLVQEKLGKGYVEVPVDGAPPAPAPRIAVKREREEKAEPEKEAEAPVEAGPAEAGRAEARPTLARPTLARPTLDRPALDLEPRDWYWATWRDTPPLPKPEAPPVDPDDLRRRLKRLSVRDYGWSWDWPAAKISPVLSREEAGFWLRAMIAMHREIKPAEVAAAMQWDEHTTSLSELAEALNERRGWLPIEFAVPMVNLYGTDAVLDLLLSDVSKKWRHRLLDGFREGVFPYLDAAERARIREKIRAAFPPASHWPSDYYEEPHAAFHLGAMFGLHDEVRAVVTSWRDDLYVGETWRDHYHRPQDMIFGLGSAREVDAHMRRMKLHLKTAAHVRAWLAHTETSALDVVRDSILRNTNKEEAGALVQALAAVHAPEVAPVMVELMLTPRTARNAREWIQTNPDIAAAGLVPIATGRGALAQEAIEILRSLKHPGFEPLHTYTELDAETTPDWLRVEVPKKKSSDWVVPDDLPPITLGDSMLTREQKATVLDALRASKLEQPHPLVTALREHADRDALDRFAWRLFELWLMNGAESKENWAMIAVGLLGGDPSALKLTPMIRVWPGESQHARAVLGLECLRVIGSDTALMQINGIAQKLKFKGLKAKAAECMEKIAQSRGLTRAQLEDRIVPDCDLDERGSRVFDFGPRKFTFVLGSDMKPLVRDESGKAKPDLPKPGAKDDPEKSSDAVADWKLLKKQIAEVAKIQAVRLEQAMVTGRRWSGEEFDLLLVKHPLMTNLVRLIVWGVFEDGRLTSTFRVTEDQTLADPHDHAFTLPPDATVGIAHPLQMTDADKNAWGELFTDYEIIPPFTQLGRPLYALEPAEAGAKELTRFAHVKLPPQTLVFTLEKLGWERGIPQDAGVYFEHSKPFYGANVTAVVSYPGVPVGYTEGWEEQTIDQCFFVPGIYTPRMYPDHQNAMTLATVPPIVISEVLSDLIQIVSKAK